MLSVTEQRMYYIYICLENNSILANRTFKVLASVYREVPLIGAPVLLEILYSILSVTGGGSEISRKQTDILFSVMTSVHQYE